MGYGTDQSTSFFVFINMEPQVQSGHLQWVYNLTCGHKLRSGRWIFNILCYEHVHILLVKDIYWRLL